MACGAYLRGNGPLASVALDAALTADQTYSLAGLVRIALDAGIRPEQFRAMLTDLAPS